MPRNNEEIKILKIKGKLIKLSNTFILNEKKHSLFYLPVASTKKYATNSNAIVAKNPAHEKA